MPIYSFRCPECGKEDDKYYPMQDDTIKSCRCICGILMHRVFSSNFNKPFKGHYSHAFGTHVRSKKELNELAKKHGAEEVGNG